MYIVWMNALETTLMMELSSEATGVLLEVSYPRACKKYARRGLRFDDPGISDARLRPLGAV